MRAACRALESVGRRNGSVLLVVWALIFEGQTKLPAVSIEFELAARSFREP